ncbi:hypothetical protein ES707_07903 [subsurface metagenome]
MRILVKIGHPAHVHFFKHFVWNMERRGHEILICATDKDVALRLLDAYQFQYICTGRSRGNLVAKIVDLLRADCRLYNAARGFKPGILTGVGSITAAHVSALLRKPCIIFDDTEHSREQYYLYSPFTDAILTPSCFRKDLGKKQVRYESYHELAYLHPNYFKPDPSVLGKVGLKPEDRFVLMRFVAWEASHDIGQHGFDMLTKKRLVKEIEKYVRVFITSERPLPEEFDKYRITTPPEEIHDLLYYAMMYIGEGATMATEAAILGTPSVYMSSLSNTMGNFVELEQKYDLIYSFREPDKAIQKATELLQQPDLKKQWAKKRQRLLSDKIDVTQFMVDLIENYPQSFYRYKEGSRK